MAAERTTLLLIGLAVFSFASVEARSYTLSSDQPPPPRPIKVLQPGKHVSMPELLPIDLSSAIETNCNGKISGDVLIATVVDPSGNPNDILVIRPAGANLDRMAVAIVSQDKFKPGEKDGQPVPVSITIDMHLQACIVPMESANGESTPKLRLLSQPVQKFGPASDQEPSSLIVEPPFVAASAENPAPMKIGSGVRPPVPISTPAAEFSEEARRRGIQGVCLISLIVDAQGVPHHLQIVRSIGYGLDAQALEAVKAYRFKPAMKDGHPVPVMMSVEVNFRLGH